MTNSFKPKWGRWLASGLCAALVLSACSLPSLPFGSTPTPRPVEVTLFFSPPAEETPTPEPEPATATPEPTVTVLPTALPTTAPTLTPVLTLTDLPIVGETVAETPVDVPAASDTPPPAALTVVVAEVRIITVVVTVTVVATAPPVATSARLTSTAAPTSALRTTRTIEPTLAGTRAITPTRTPRPTPVPVVTVAPVILSNVLALAYKSNIKSDPWGVPFNEDGCTQFDDRRPGRKVYLELIIRALDASVNSWNVQFYQGASPFPTCISDPYIQHGTLRERDIPASGYPLPFDISKTLIAFVPEGQNVTQLKVFANGKAELCFALNGASADPVSC